MTVYPFALDDDQTIIRIDDNLSELGTEAINQLRSAVFAIERELGINPSGSLSSVTDRFSVSHNDNGTIKASALTSVGLATLPIDDAQVGANAGIQESKLALDFTTANLNALIQANSALINTTAAFVATTNADLLLHISGAVVLSDGSTLARHVASQIDLNDVTSDSRDPSFIWNGLIDKDGNQRTATTVAEALLQINDEFVSHQLDETGGAHFASGISVDTTNFLVIPQDADTVQKALDAIDEADALVIQKHQENLHSNGIPTQSRVNLIGNTDGYSWNVIPDTPASAYLVNPPATSPVDNNTTGDDVIAFAPDNTDFEFDEKFAKVQVGDVVRINYGNGVEAVFNVKSKRHIPGSEWIIRINGNNLDNAVGDSAFARIDKKRFNTNKYGTLAVASANNDIDPSIPSSLIVGNPNSAQALGIAFDPTQLDTSHYLLYLAYYPTGNPEDEVVELPAIDVTGDLGNSPGSYTVNSIVQATNNAFRAGGYNYRFIAFERDGEFGIMMSDAVSTASFSVINGSINAGSLDEGVYVNNVVGDATDGRDALGFGISKGQVASPRYSGSYSSAEAAASLPTIIWRPLQEKNFVVNGISRDDFASTYLANDEGYWDGYISERTPVGASTVEITYQVTGDLSPAKLKPGKTITVQPAVDRSDALFNEVDYGRFIIKDVSFNNCCPGSDPYTTITVINGLHATGTVIGTTGVPPLAVRLYFGEDSVGFNDSNVIDAINADPYVRYHEVFINEEGETFSYERARMPQQAQSTSLLNTQTSWKIHEVSPKLKGYLDDGTSDTNRFIRFYVLSYDSTSGEYDGYLGRRGAGTDIFDFGRVVRARKNVPTRFYDGSDVDYITLEYSESDQEPGSLIMPVDLNQRYVDIEIFDSLAASQENFRLAGCVFVNDTVECVNDLREFGNVSEIDFTDSAVKFIESGERHLHSNGVINGFTYIGESGTLPGTLSFNGGVALVNGHMSTLSSQSISIPEIVRVSGGEITDLDWAVCVNDEDLLEVIPVTSTKLQFFGKISGALDNYYIPSVTFSELVNSRRDLTPIALVNVTIASVTVNSVLDVRKFIEYETANIPLSMYRNDDVTGTSEGLNLAIGNFNSFEQVITWANNIGGDFYVRVKGQIVVEDEVDFTDLSSGNTLILDGRENGVIYTDLADSVFRVGSNLHIKNLKFIYNSDVSGVSASDNGNLDLDAACVIVDAKTVDRENVRVEGCEFSRTASGLRPPFVMVQTDNGRTFSNGSFSSNKFTPHGDDALNCAIALYNASGNDSTPAVLALLENVKVSDNEIGLKNSILISSDESSNYAPAVARDVIVSRNYMPSGYIGHNTCTTKDGYFEQSIGLSIKDNTCTAIVTASANGKITNSLNPTIGTGIVDIVNNKCRNIYSYILNFSNDLYGNGVHHSKLLIEGNVLRSTNISSTEIDSDIELTSVEPSNSPFAAIRAIGSVVNTTGGSQFAGALTIRNNQIFGTNDSNKYDSGIYAAPNSSLIEGNVINYWTNYGIITFGTGSIVRNNSLFRREQTVLLYINGSGDCYDNYLDSTTVDGSTENTIAWTGYVERNVNHIKEIQIPLKNTMKTGSRREYQSSTPWDGGTGIVHISSTSFGYSSTVSFQDGVGPAQTQGEVYFAEWLPPGTKVTNVSMDFNSVNASWAGGSISLSVIRDGDLYGGLSDSDNLTSVTGTLEIPISDDTVNYERGGLYFGYNSVTATGAKTSTLSNLVVKYTW